MISSLLAIIYLAFISLGLPDSVLGSAWPSMFAELGVPVSYAGIISMIIAIGTVISSLFSDKLTRRLGAGKVTTISTALTAFSLLGFSFSHSFPLLCFLAIPYGLGAGSIDAALNNYVALHFASRHMSWLHCMWGVGTIIGPNVMGYALTSGQTWNDGYRYVSFIQIAFTAILVCSIPLWNKHTAQSNASSSPESAPAKELSPWEATKIRGAKEIFLTFFCYCALEQTAMLWAASYLVFHNGISEDRAASYASILFIGITVGRFINGFLTIKFKDAQMIRIGESVVLLGIAVLLLPLDQVGSFIGIALIGLGCAPIYPCIIHSTPEHFGADKSQAMIGIQMACAYIGTCLMPPLFGYVVSLTNVSILPIYLVFFLGIMALAHEKMLKETRAITV